VSYATDQVPLKDGSLVTRTYLLKKQKKTKTTTKKPTKNPMQVANSYNTLKIFTAY